jgi:3-oxoadipate enol-lactonase
VDEPGPNLPAGRAIHLPGRGRTWVYDSADGLASAGACGPPGATNPPTGALGQQTVVLMHGWTSTAALNWYRCFAPLATEFRVVAMDHRGHGRGIRSRRPFRLEDCADDVAALIRQLGTGPVTAVGYSMGGTVAQLLWHRHPDVVDGLVLCATAARFSSRAELRSPFGARGALGVIGAGVAMALSSVPFTLRRHGFRRLVRSQTADRGLAPWAIAEWERNDPAALVQAGVALGRFDSTSWINGVDVPTSVVVTTEDGTVSPIRQWTLAKSIPGARVFPVAGDHRACAEQAREFVPALLAACRAARRSATNQRAAATT